MEMLVLVAHLGKFTIKECYCPQLYYHFKPVSPHGNRRYHELHLDYITNPERGWFSLYKSYVALIISVASNFRQWYSPAPTIITNSGRTVVQHLVVLSMEVGTIVHGCQYAARIHRSVKCYQGSRRI